MYPFILVVGTKNRSGEGEEYRWAILPVSNIPDRDAVFCRDATGEMQKEFLLRTFWRSQRYQSYNELVRGIRQYRYVGCSYVMQIEHFPDEYFPTITDGA